MGFVITDEALFQKCHDSARNFADKTLGFDRLEEWDRGGKRIGNIEIFPCDISKVTCHIVVDKIDLSKKILVANWVERSGSARTEKVMELGRTASYKKKGLADWLKTCERFYKIGLSRAVEMALTRCRLKGYRRAERLIMDRQLC